MNQSPSTLRANSKDLRESFRQQSGVPRFRRERAQEVKKVPFFQCPLCAESRDVRTDKNGKPYITCDSCGVQVFMRGKVAQERLQKLLELMKDSEELE